MTAFDSVDSDHIDWSNSLAVTCTIPLASDSRLISTWLEDEDFLHWSCRQRDAEIVVEYDV